MAARLTLNEFILKSINTHGERYKYDKCEYKNARTDVVIGCKEHGYFSQLPQHHMAGSGCPQCNKGATEGKSIKEYIKDFKRVHEDRYDYSKTKKFGYREPVRIDCRLHGPFYQRIDHHVYGMNCPKCAYRDRAGYFSEEDMGNPCILYHIEITNHDNGNVFQKIGITTRGVKTRFASAKYDNISYRILRQCKDTVRNCLFLETMLLESLAHQDMLYKVHDMMDKRCAGWTECFYPKSWYN